MEATARAHIRIIAAHLTEIAMDEEAVRSYQIEDSRSYAVQEEDIRHRVSLLSNTHTPDQIILAVDAIMRGTTIAVTTHTTNLQITQFFSPSSIVKLRRIFKGLTHSNPL